MELRVGDRAAFPLHPLPTEGGICPQQLLIALAIDDVLARIPGFRHVALARYRMVLHHNSRLAARWPPGWSQSSPVERPRPLESVLC